MKYYIYMLRCSDNSLYTGITTDSARRMQEHFSASAQCAKYTRSHPPQKLEALWSCDGRAAASRLEYRIKRLTRKKKLDAAEKNDLSFLGEDAALYKREEDMPCVIRREN